MRSEDPKLAVQEAIHQFSLLLELGAEIEGSPACERTLHLFNTYWAVLSPILHCLIHCPHPLTSPRHFLQP